MIVDHLCTQYCRGIITFSCHHLWHCLLLRLWKHCTGHTGARPSMREGGVRVWSEKNTMSTKQTKSPAHTVCTPCGKCRGEGNNHKDLIIMYVFCKVTWHAVVTWVWRVHVCRSRQWNVPQRWAPSGGGGTSERVGLWWVCPFRPECLRSSAGRTRPLGAPHTQQTSCYKHRASHQHTGKPKTCITTEQLPGIEKLAG